MTAIEERREIAERLRGGYDTFSDGYHVWLNGTLFGSQMCAESEEKLRNAVKTIADLIEPCDRDALLALADEIDAKSNDGTVNPDPMKPIASSLDLFGYASRIREAVGS